MILTFASLVLSWFGTLAVFCRLWQMEFRRRTELEVDRERLIDRIRYLSDAPPRPFPGPPTGPEVPEVPATVHFRFRPGPETWADTLSAKGH